MKPLEFETLSDLKKFIGNPFPDGEWYIITQQMINDFASATKDRQWIHVDEQRAKKESPFKTTVAHGFMSVAMISKMLEELFTVKSVTMGLNYGLNKVRFPNPVPVNSQLRMKTTLQNVEDLANNGKKVTFNCIIEIKGQKKPACIAEFIAALFE